MNMRHALHAEATPLESLEEEGRAGWLRRFALPPDFLAFAGHFPGHPVLPAVVQCLMAQMAVEEGLGRPLRLLSVTQAKFTAVLRPAQEITLRVVPARKEAHWDCTLHAGEVPAARIQLHMLPKEAL